MAYHNDTNLCYHHQGRDAIMKEKENLWSRCHIHEFNLELKSRWLFYQGFMHVLQSI